MHFDWRLNRPRNQSNFRLHKRHEMLTRDFSSLMHVCRGVAFQTHVKGVAETVIMSRVKVFNYMVYYKLSNLPYNMKCILPLLETNYTMHTIALLPSIL